MRLFARVCSHTDYIPDLNRSDLPHNPLDQAALNGLHSLRQLTPWSNHVMRILTLSGRMVFGRSGPCFLACFPCVIVTVFLCSVLWSFSPWSLRKGKAHTRHFRHCALHTAFAWNWLIQIWSKSRLIEIFWKSNLYLSCINLHAWFKIRSNWINHCTWYCLFGLTRTHLDRLLVMIWTYDRDHSGCVLCPSKLML